MGHERGWGRFRPPSPPPVGGMATVPCASAPGTAVKADGNCLFRSVAVMVTGDAARHDDVRQAAHSGTCTDDGKKGVARCCCRTVVDILWSKTASHFSLLTVNAADVTWLQAAKRRRREHLREQSRRGLLLDVDVTDVGVDPATVAGGFS